MEPFRSLVGANSAKRVSGDKTATVDDLEEKGWVGSYANTELLLIRRNAFETSIELKENYKRLPFDAAALYEHWGEETLVVGVGRETLRKCRSRWGLWGHCNRKAPESIGSTGFVFSQNMLRRKKCHQSSGPT